MISSFILTLMDKTVACTYKGGTFLTFPTWYHYLPGKIDPATKACSPQLTDFSDVWLIVAAIIEILLQVAALVSVFFVIYGGISFVTSQGDSEKAAQARKTVINALIGLAISVSAAATITFIAGRIKAS